MEEWTGLRDDGGNAKQSFWFNFDFDFPIEKYRFDPCKERLRSLFDQLLVAFMNEKSTSNCIRPIPALCGDGRPVDLFKLFWVVRKIGGHESVSEKNLWDFVSEECGFGIRVVPTIKLIHEKYLNELDQWFRQLSVSNRISERENCGLIRKLDLLCREIVKLSRDDQGENVKFSKDRNGGIDEFDKNTNDFAASAKRVVKKAVAKRVVKNAIEKVVKNETNGFSKGQVDGEDNGNITKSAKKVIEKVMNKVLNCEGTISINDDKLSVISKTRDLTEKVIEDDKRVSVQQIIDNGNVLDSRKRKRKSRAFSEMLKWLTHVAKHPNDPSVGIIPECSKWGEYGNEELWVQAISARDTLLIRKHDNTNAGENLLKDDVLDHQSPEKLRCSKRVPTSPKSQLCPCCNSTAAQTKAIVHQEANQENSQKSPMNLVHTDVDNPPNNSNDPKSMDMPVERQVSVGPLFQAQVPEWTGVTSESDPKWLGTRMWPQKDGAKKSITIIKSAPVGKGKQRSCKCPFPNSVECFRFHVAEKRLKLKRELGSLFYRWRFDRMGEEVSLSWTEEEENKFKDMIRSHAEFPNRFWNNAPRFFPFKTREKLVSYYFNVFVVHRRSYQNRVTPKDVDSDDDEKECGSIGGYFGYKALYVPRSSLVSCTLNKESYELV
ncbi:AT-rich interactive domain-containing protein 2 [Phtheirospermum japonicum]|uniref:AT-rich interactive domain-containing protein 2 n=1 Tax=Phtheirospermum japonicum TaxID=374723 RepID=A0A830CNY4_9LAMI|nr:AT-rich interactive domain-containing protein 2 [Phtheirospermum japonicum]